MTAHPEQTLPEAALQRLLDEAPHVRLLARTLLAEEADEVVQQTWLHAVEHGGRGIERPRPWLSRIVRNVAANLRRSKSRRLAHEADAGGPDPVPSSAELLAREEQRRRLVAAVDRLPEPFRQVVVLRYFEGLNPRDIALRLELPASTVWNRNREAMRMLRAQLDHEHGGRSSWIGPLAIFVREPGRGLPVPTQPVLPTAATTLLAGAIFMTAKVKLAAAAILIVAGAVAWWQLDPWANGIPIAPTTDTAANTAAGGIEPPVRPGDGEAATRGAAERWAIPAVEPPTTGSLIVNVRYKSDQSPAADVAMLLRRPGHDDRLGIPRQRTDAEGRVRFEDLTPQQLLLTSDRGFRGKVVDIVAGRATEIDFEIPSGLTVTGIVVDPLGVPIAGALVEHVPFTRANVDPSTVGRTGANGRFTLRDLPTDCLIGARARGYCASELAFLMGKKGNTADIRLELGSGGGSVDGLVVNGDGEPLADAIVVIGEGRITGIEPGMHGAPPLPAFVRTNAAGRFHAIGIPAGTQPVNAMAADQAPWRGQCEVAADLTISLRIAMSAGAVLRGVALADDEAAVAGVEIRVGDWLELANFQTRSAADGTFELTGLPTGELLLHATHRERGKADVTIATSVGEPALCVVHLSRGLVLIGRVVDDCGKAVENALLECYSDYPQSRFGNAFTDTEGNFAIANCPEGVALTLRIRANGYESQQRVDVDPKRGKIEIRMPRLPPTNVRITGRILDPDGRPLANAVLCPYRQNSRRSTRVFTTGTDGVFELAHVEPGNWCLFVHQPGHPSWRSEWRELRADDYWDLGDIRLPAGGLAQVVVNGNRQGLDFRIVEHARDLTTTLTERDGYLHSEPLAAGAHHLFVAGGTTAAQAIPFDVTAGQTTHLTVLLQPGVRQRIEASTRALGDGVPGLEVIIQRGNDLVAQRWLVSESGTAAGELHLLPGDYTLQATVDERQVGPAHFSVGDEPGAAVRFVAR